MVQTELEQPRDDAPAAVGRVHHGIHVAAADEGAVAQPDGATDHGVDADDVVSVLAHGDA